jgi:hypothetical protein
MASLGASPARNLVVLVDALGWLTVERTGFMARRLPFRRRLTTVFGYSSTAVPSLLTGALPVEHGHWFLYRRSRGSSPFREAALVARLPGRVRDSWRVRTRLQEYWRKKADIKGYFSLYNVPMRVLPDLEPVEVRDTWAPGAFPGTPSLVDELVRREESFHLSDWRVPDAEKLARAARAVEAEAPRTVLLYLTEIDAVQHRVGPESPELDRALGVLAAGLEDLVARMERRGPVGISLFSDHGMTPVRDHRDLLGALDAAGLRRGRDYEGFFDSTVARFWEIGDPAALRRVLDGLEWGTVLDPETLHRWGVDFPDRAYGDLIFLADPGVLILPSDMGAEPITAMHGYTPEHPTSDACFLADREVALEREHITAVLPALRRRLEGSA